jgi:hypothetical protein
VGPILGSPISWFPLYLGPAVVVELIGLTPLIKRPIVFGALSGLGVATLGLFLESLWIANVYYYPWPTSMWLEALAMAVPVAVLVGMCGAMLGMVFTGQQLPRRAIGIGIVAATVLVIGGATFNGLQYSVPGEDTQATIKLHEVPNTDRHMFTADVQIYPDDLISANPEWVSVLAWQGGLANDRGIVIDKLQRDGHGHYVSTKPIPLWGSWKTVLRVQDGKTMTGVPIYLAADPGIGKGAEGVAVRQLNSKSIKDIFGTSHFVPEITMLQRERSFDHGTLWPIGGFVVLACTLVLIAGLTWGAGRINLRGKETSTDAPSRPHAEV